MELNGSCLCGEVKYSVSTELLKFYFCHCEQCRKITGSSFTSNILAKPSVIKWVTGEENIKRFDYPGNRSFTKVFCKECVSGITFLNEAKQLYSSLPDHWIVIQKFALIRTYSGVINRLGMKLDWKHLDATGFLNVNQAHNESLWIDSYRTVAGGQGTPIILITGFPQSWYAWRRVMPIPADRYQVVAIDLPGQGASDKPVDRYDTESTGDRVHVM